MDHTLTAIPVNTINTLRDEGCIESVAYYKPLQAKEKRALQRLLSVDLENCDLKQIYLNSYDRLFRHISLALLAQGFALSDYQPHQTLRSIANLYEKPSHVSQMIALRHRLKKTDAMVDSAHYQSCLQTLSSLLARYDPADSQACQKQQTAQQAL